MGNGMGFPIANLAPWSSMHSLRIKDFTAQECASRVAKDVESYVLPFVASVQSEQKYLELLLADEKINNITAILLLEIIQQLVSHGNRQLLSANGELII